MSRCEIIDIIDSSLTSNHLDDWGESVAVVNDYHFWAVVESRLPGLGCTPQPPDKGEHLPFQSDGPTAGEYSPADMAEDNQDQEHH